MANILVKIVGTHFKSEHCILEASLSYTLVCQTTTTVICSPDTVHGRLDQWEVDGWTRTVGKLVK